MRIGRARVAGGFDPGDRQPAFGSQDASGAFIGAGAAGSQLGSSSSALAQGSGAPDEVDSGSRFRPWSEPAQAGPGPMRCHFLRSVEPDGCPMPSERRFQLTAVRPTVIRFHCRCGSRSWSASSASTSAARATFAARSSRTRTRLSRTRARMAPVASLF